MSFRPTFSSIHMILYILLSPIIAGASGLREEYNLLKDVLTMYDPAARPVLNLTDVVEVRMGIALFQIRELVSYSTFKLFPMPKVQ